MIRYKKSAKGGFFVGVWLQLSAVRGRTLQTPTTMLTNQKVGVNVISTKTLSEFYFELRRSFDF